MLRKAYHHFSDYIQVLFKSTSPVCVYANISISLEIRLASFMQASVSSFVLSSTLFHVSGVEYLYFTLLPLPILNYIFMQLSTCTHNFPNNLHPFLLRPTIFSISFYIYSTYLLDHYFFFDVSKPFRFIVSHLNHLKSSIQLHFPNVVIDNNDFFLNVFSTNLPPVPVRQRDALLSWSMKKRVPRVAIYSSAQIQNFFYYYHHCCCSRVVKFKENISMKPFVNDRICTVNEQKIL